MVYKCMYNVMIMSMGYSKTMSDAIKTWDLMINTNLNLLRKFVYCFRRILYKIRHYLSKQTLLNMYYTFVFPYLIYGVEILGSALLNHINPFKKRRKSVRTITFSDYLAPSERIFQSLKVLNFEKLVIQRISFLMFNLNTNSHGKVPVSVSQLFRANNEYHNYNTINCARIHAPVGTAEASYRTFGYRGIYIWNHIS